MGSAVLWCCHGHGVVPIWRCVLRGFWSGSFPSFLPSCPSLSQPSTPLQVEGKSSQTKGDEANPLILAVISPC